MLGQGNLTNLNHAYITSDELCRQLVRSWRMNINLWLNQSLGLKETKKEPKKKLKIIMACLVVIFENYSGK